ncbi:MAG: alpha/beta hydrolase [Rhodospirillaceae bacterium]|nr:alpha/beta hydrolase [Rhodospirillaceae bacterium]MBT6961645.1 alpha/beta hydrolase [Rhodospirillaceae bacterium]MBT7450499.1 alpha/beta hydrolase [Rhodospirillaceae bacterium]
MNDVILTGEKNNMSPANNAMRRGYADGPFGQIHYRISGDSTEHTPLLLLHPSPLSGVVWDGFIGEMGNDRIAVAPDTPGFGESAPPQSEPEIADYAKAMAAFLKEMGLSSVDIMGYHTGSLTALEMARLYPDMVRNVVMISATVFTEKERDDFRAQYTPQTVDEKGAGLSERWAFIKGFWRDEPDDARRWQIFIEGQRNHAVMHWGHRAAFNFDMAAALEAATVPILVLNPEDDLWTYTPRAAPLMKTGRVHDLPGWTHGFLDAHTGEVATLVRDFLDS